MIKKFRDLKNHQGFIRYFKNTTWLFAEKILKILVGIIVSIWMARYLGAEQFGLYNYIISFVGLFTVLSTLGLDNIVVRELTKNESQRDQLLGTAFTLKLTGAIFVLVILIISFSNFSSNESENLMIYLVASTMIFQCVNVIDFYFQSKVLSKYIVFSNVIVHLVSFCVKIYLILDEAPLMLFFYVVLFDSIILALGYIFFYLFKKLSIKKWKFKWSLATKLLKDSWPLMLSGFAIAVYMKIDQVMIKEMLGSAAVGQYAVAVKLSESWYFIPMIIASSLFPAIINAKVQDEVLYELRLQRLYSLMFILAICIALPITFMSNWIVVFLYSEEYYLAGQILMIHIWSGIFVFWGVAASQWFIVENLQIYSTINTCIGAIVNVFLNYILINIYGVEGAAWSTLISMMVSAYICLIFFKKTRVNFFRLSNSIFFLRSFNAKKNN